MKAISFYLETEKILNQNCDISVENRQTKFQDLKSCVCVLTHTKFQKVEFTLSVFHRNITILTSNSFPCQNRKLWLLIDILITYKYFLILVAELAKIKFLKSRKKTTLSNVLNFAPLHGLSVHVSTFSPI